LSLKTFADNETLFRKGDEGNHFYLIRSGAVDIIDETDGTERSVGQLGVHDYFGEIALIRNVPRTMTARAVGETQTLRLGKAATLQLIEGSKLFAANINRAGEDRIVGNDRSKPLGFVR
jgi:ATP-binding cassette subfamily B protein